MRHIALLFVLALSAAAASNRTVTVKASGGDYTSLAAAIAGEKGDLVSLDRQLTIECYSIDDTTSLIIANADWVTDATRYILITVPTAERHAGVWSDDKYNLTVGSANAIQIHSTEFVRLEGLQIFQTGNYHAIYLGGPDTGAGDVRIYNCIIRGDNSLSAKGLIFGTYTGGSSFVVRVWNNLLYGASASTGYAIRIEITGTYNFWNNTIQGNGVGVYRTNGTVILKNNLLSANTTNGGGALAAGTDYNRTSNSALGYTVTGSGNTHDAVSQTFTFADSVNKDWHLHESDTGARDRGVNDAGSGMYSSDVDGETRYGTWDVGADEYPSAARRRNAIVAWAREIQREKE